MICTKRKDAIGDCVTQLRKLQTLAEQLKGSKLRWYEKYTNGDISKPEYLKFKADVDKKLAENEEAQREAESRMEQLDSERTCSDDRLDATCRDIQKSRQITYELAHAFIIKSAIKYYRFNKRFKGRFARRYAATAKHGHYYSGDYL